MRACIFGFVAFAVAVGTVGSAFGQTLFQPGAVPPTPATAITPPPEIPVPPGGVPLAAAPGVPPPPALTAGQETPAGMAAAIRGVAPPPIVPGVTAGMSHVGGGPGLSGLAPAPGLAAPIRGVPGTVTAADIGSWAGPNLIGLKLGDVSGPLEAIGSPPGLIDDPLSRPGISYGGSRAGTPAASVVGGIGLAAGVPQPNFVGRSIQPNIQPWANTRVGAGLASDYGVYGGRVISSGGDVGGGYGSNDRARRFLNNYGTPVLASPFGNTVESNLYR